MTPAVKQLETPGTLLASAHPNVDPYALMLAEDLIDSDLDSEGFRGSGSDHEQHDDDPHSVSRVHNTEEVEGSQFSKERTPRKLSEAAKHKDESHDHSAGKESFRLVDIPAATSMELPMVETDYAEKLQTELDKIIDVLLLRRKTAQGQDRARIWEMIEYLAGLQVKASGCAISFDGMHKYSCASTIDMRELRERLIGDGWVDEA